jgi:hypothetical protein
MLELQRKKLFAKIHRKYIFCMQLASIVVLMHIGLLAYLSLYRGDTRLVRHITINRHIDFSNIVLIPEVATIPGSVEQIMHKTDTALSSGIVKAPVVKRAEAVTKPKAVVPKKAPAKPEKPAPVAKSTTVEPTKPKEVAKKSIKKTDSPPIVQKNVQTPALVNKPMQEKQPDAKTPLLAALGKQQESVATTTVAQSAEVIYIGKQDAVLLQEHMILKDTIERVWRPPLGISKDAACRLGVTINVQGTVDAVVVEQSSHIVSYDIAARTALINMVFPKTMRGTTVSITFKQ